MFLLLEHETLYFIYVFTLHNFKFLSENTEFKHVFSVSELPPLPPASRTASAEFSVRERMREKLKAARVRFLQKSCSVDFSHFACLVLCKSELRYLLF